jgi:hypothetical protein
VTTIAARSPNTVVAGIERNPDEIVDELNSLFLDRQVGFDTVPNDVARDKTEILGHHRILGRRHR